MTYGYKDRGRWAAYKTLSFTLLFIYLTTILLQAVAWLVQSCRVTSSFDNITTQKELKKQMETQKQIHCIASISYSASGTHQQYWIQHWSEVDASGTSYRYNDDCNRSAPTKKYNRKARISHKWCTRSRGYYQNLLQDLRKSSTAQNTATGICDGSSSGKPNKKIRSNWTLLKQSKNSGDLLSVTILQTLLKRIARAASWKLQ